MNILLQAFDTEFTSAPFTQIKTEDFKPAILEHIQSGKKEIDAIVNETASPSFKNTIEALERSGEMLGRVTSILFNLNSAETSDELQKVTQEVSPILTEHGNDITLNEALFKRVEAVYKNRAAENLEPESLRLLEKTYKSFVRNGAALQDDKKEILRELNKELGLLSLQFGQNVLAETNAYQLHIVEEEKLEGLPDYAISGARSLAESEQKQGWIFTLQYPSYIPFMKFCKDRNLREQLYKAFASRSFKDNEFNNEKLIAQIVEKRQKRAEILGYKTHADFVLEERMVRNTSTVFDFLEDLLEKAYPLAQTQIKELETFAESSDELTGELCPWDHSYYSEKLKEKKFALSEEELKPYFQLEKVQEGAFTIATKLFGLEFKKRDDIEVYHKDVEVFEVFENGKHKALLYTDFFPRKGKRAGAWMTSFKGQKIVDGENQRPHISIVCNFTPATEKLPSLLTFQEVTTLFHEFGHALHGILADTKYGSLSGTSVYWDFVELPSQFMENFCFEKEALELFAHHYQTGALIPDELIEKIKKSATFLEGYQTVRQIGLGLLDMAYHSEKLSEFNTLDKNVAAFEKKVGERTKIYPAIAGANTSTAFSHIFQGGYSSGYYSYKWAEVLDADAFEAFKEKGIFNKEIAESFKQNILSKGGTKDPMELYKAFRGKEPSNKALLERAGLK